MKLYELLEKLSKIDKALYNRLNVEIEIGYFDGDHNCEMTAAIDSVYVEGYKLVFSGWES